MNTRLLILANERIRLSVAPDFGARVTELRDLATGRNWLVEGPLTGSVKGDASYLGEEARGWDECFPTVAPCAHSGWPSRLRDHGEPGEKHEWSMTIKLTRHYAAESTI